MFLAFNKLASFSLKEVSSAYERPEERLKAVNKFSIFQRSPSDAREATKKRTAVGEGPDKDFRESVRVVKDDPLQPALLWPHTMGSSPPDDHPQAAFLIVLCRIIQTP